MAPTTREGQRAEVHRTIWRVATDLRGSVDGWDFKNYVLGFLFYRFISENLTAYLNGQERQAASPNTMTMNMNRGDQSVTRLSAPELPRSAMGDRTWQWISWCSCVGPRGRHSGHRPRAHHVRRR